MKNQDVRNLRRSDLLEILIEQNREIERLQKELGEAREKLAARELAVKECGSVAEAALRVNGVYESAQAACDQYLYNIRLRGGSAGPGGGGEPRRASEEAAPRKPGTAVLSDEYWAELSGRIRHVQEESEIIRAMLAEMPRIRSRQP